MEQPIYGDVLFIINFSMDFLTLFVVGKIMHRAIKLLRYCFAAAIGALYGVASVFLSGNSIISIFINIAVSILMCYIAYGSKILSCTALFYCIGCLLGGGMTALYHLVNKSFSSAVYAYGSIRPLPESIPLGWMAVIALIIGIAAIICGRISSRHKSSAPVKVRVHIFPSSDPVEFEALTDSGNLLTEPISGAPVIIAGRDIILKAAGDELFKIMSCDISDAAALNFGLMKKVRFIPISDVRGSGMIVGIMPFKITIDETEVQACLALDKRSQNSKENGYGGYAGIVPSVLCSGEKSFSLSSISRLWRGKGNAQGEKQDKQAKQEVKQDKQDEMLSKK